MYENDCELIQNILAGDEAAFSDLVQKYQKSVHALVWRKIGDFHIAEEITQDTFLQAYDKLSTLKDPNLFVGWLHVIANRRCIAWLRKKRVVMQSLDLTSEEILEKTAYAYYIAEQRELASAERRREIVENLLEKLPETQRKTIILHYLGEMSCQAISKLLGVSLNTVKSRLNRARNRLKQEEPRLQDSLDQEQGDNIMEDQKTSIPIQVGSFEGDVTTWVLPEGALARLGRGSEPKMTFSPDGKYLVIGTCIGLWIYELATLSPVAFWEVEQWVVGAVAFSPNGKWIAANKSGGKILILNVQNGTCLTQMKSEEFIHSMTFSDDNRFLAAAYYTSPDVAVWHAETGKPFARFTPDPERAGTYRPICFSPDTRLIASTFRLSATDEAESIIVWSMESREKVASLSAHTRCVTTLCFSPCGKFLATGGEDGTVYVWDVSTWEQVQCYTDYGDVYGITPSYSPEGILFAAIDTYDKMGPATISVRNLESGEELYTDQVWGNTIDFSYTGDWGNTVVFSNGSQLAYECRHESINVWTTDNPTKRQFTHSPISFPTSAVFSGDGKTLAVQHHHEGVVLWDIVTKRSRPAIKDVLAGKNQFVHKTDDGKLYATSIQNDTVTLWEADSDEMPLIETTGREYWSAFPVLSPTGTLFACADGDGNIHVWDVKNRERIFKLTHPLEPSDNKVDDDEDDGDFVDELEFSHDGKLLVSESKTRNVKLWDMELGQEIELLSSCKVTGFRFCDCGQHLVCFGDEVIPYWDITHREFCEDDNCLYESKKYKIERRLSLPKEYEYIEKPVFTTCGQYIAFITSWNKVTKSYPICLFEAESGKHLVTFRGHSSDGTALVLSPDNKLLASASHDGTVLLWDLTPYIQLT